MDKDEPPEETVKDQHQAADIDAGGSDVDLNHVRGLMYALVTICVFCASILLGPDGQILPADGDLELPIVKLKIKQGSFLYFGPIIIISVSMYTYLFLLKILARVKAGRVNSDKYIFTMNNPAAQFATYGIFFWLPSLVLFAFAYKGVPRPESNNLLGVALIFLIIIVSIQLVLRIDALRIKKFNFLGVIAISSVCVVVVFYGFVGDEDSQSIEEKGWLERVRMFLLTHREMVLEKAVLEKRDLRRIEIRNARADTLQLNDADLREAVIKDTSLSEAKLVNADLRDAILDCSDLINADFEKADLRNAKLRRSNFKEAKFRYAKLERADFHNTEAGVTCSGKRIYHTSLEDANLEEANLSEANLSNVTLTGAKLNGAILEDTVIIGAKIKSSFFMEKIKMDTMRRIPTVLKRVDLRCSLLNKAKMQGAILIKAELGGTNFTRADLNNVDLSGTFFNPLSCSGSCKNSYMTRDNNCSGEELRKSQEKCSCDKKDITSATLVEANLQFANLTKSSLKGVDLRKADLRGANLHGADLSEAKIEGAKFLLAQLTAIEGLDCLQLKAASYWKAAIRDEKLECGEKYLNFEDFVSGSNETGKKADTVEFQGVLEKFAEISRKRPQNWKDRTEHIRSFRKLENAKMTGINLSNLNLESLYLNNAELDKTLLSGAILKDVKLRKANLSGSNLKNADLSGAILSGANLSGANLSGAKGLTCDQLESAENWELAYRDDELECGGTVPSGLYISGGLFR